jgi:tellurite resistance protein TerC
VNPFIVYTSNIFSILGLRALYFALAGCMEVFKYLVNGVTLVLIFIGLKMLVSGFYEIPPLLALGMIVALLAASIGLSILRPARGPSGAELRGNFK